MTGWQWHQMDHTQIICTSLQTDNHTSTSSLIFYRMDALPDTQPTVSKHTQIAQRWFCIPSNWKIGHFCGTLPSQWVST